MGKASQVIQKFGHAVGLLFKLRIRKPLSCTTVFWVDILNRLSGVIAYCVKHVRGSSAELTLLVPLGYGRDGFTRCSLPHLSEPAYLAAPPHAAQKCIVESAWGDIIIANRAMNLALLR